MSSFFPSLESFAKGTATTAAAVGTLSLGLLYYGQNYLIYPSAFPQGSRDQVPVPSEFGLPYTDLTLTTSDNVRVKAYLLTQRRHLDIHGAKEITWTFDEIGAVGADASSAGDDEKDGDGERLSAEDARFAASRPTVLMFHGNGGNHGHRIPLARIFFLRMRANVIMLSYRGYGLSEGTPSEKGLQLDAQAALDYVRDNRVLRGTPVVLYGQSIGGAVAIDLASRFPDRVRALVLENTFTSLPRLIPTAMPFLSPVAWLCHQKWESYLKLPRIPKRIPILLLGGVRDEVVARAHMHDLWALTRARGSPRQPTLSTPSKPSSKSKNTAAFVSGRAAAAQDPLRASAPNERGEEKEGRDGDDAPGEVTQESPPPVSAREGEDRFVEFGAGTHNDTCVQPGYWQTITDFIDGLDGVRLAADEDRAML